jgi:hypothetical protein
MIYFFWTRAEKQTLYYHIIYYMRTHTKRTLAFSYKAGHRENLFLILQFPQPLAELEISELFGTHGRNFHRSSLSMDVSRGSHSSLNESGWVARAHLMCEGLDFFLLSITHFAYISSYCLLLSKLPAPDSPLLSSPKNLFHWFISKT